MHMQTEHPLADNIMQLKPRCKSIGVGWGALSLAVVSRKS
jgi:hypothetical protein